MKITGLAGESEERVSTHFCSFTRKILTSWQTDIGQMFLNAHGIKGNMIAQKVQDAVAKVESDRTSLQGQLDNSNAVEFKDYSSKLLEAMAPLLCMSRLKNNSGQGQTLDKKSDKAHLDAHMRFTEGQAVPFRPGKNSRSKAKFFFSPDSSLIIKMIREEEYKTLWGMVNDCSYSTRLTEEGYGKSSLLNPIVLAFMDAGQYWIIMQRERTPPIVADKLPPKEAHWRRDFHNDIKPGNMVSDRKDVAKMVMNERMLTGLQMVPALDVVMARLEIDVDYLASKDLMDYSLLVYGSFIELDHNDKGSRDFFSPTAGPDRDTMTTASAKKLLESLRQSSLGLNGGSLTSPSPKQWLQKAVTLTPQCGMACSERPRKLVDVTRQLKREGESHYRVSAKLYRCCCIEMKPGDSALIRSPCALVQLAEDSGKMKCGDLLGSRFHSYHRPLVGGRCLIEWDQWPETAGLKFLSGHTAYDAKDSSTKSQEAATLQQMKITDHVESCAIVCVSVADYLLQSTFGKQMENIVLIPVYRGRKWSAYDTKTVHLLRCLLGGQPPTEQLLEDKKRPGLVSLFRPSTFPGPPRPTEMNEMTWNDCKDVFPEVQVLDDMKLVERLVQATL